MTFTFRNAKTINDAAGVFVSLTGGTNSGKTFSALKLARGIAGPGGRIAVLDTEGGRTLHLRDQFDFDGAMMEPPFRPERFSQAAIDAEAAGYACLVIDSFSMEWIGMGGVLDWHDEELQRMGGDDYRKRERVKMAAWIKPKSEHKAMVYSLLQRRIPIIFSIRGEESVKPAENGGAPQKIFKSLCNKSFPYEVTVAFRLAADKKGYVDLSDPATYKMEGAHAEIFKDGDRISEEHGAVLKRWSQGLGVAPIADAAKAQPGEAIPARNPETARLVQEGFETAEGGVEALKIFWGRLTPAQKKDVGGKEMLERWQMIAGGADMAASAEAERPGELAEEGA